jgi:hypothetical protein
VRTRRFGAALAGIAVALVCAFLLLRSCGTSSGPPPGGAPPEADAPAVPAPPPPAASGVPAGPAEPPPAAAAATSPAPTDPAPAATLRIHGRLVDEGKTGIAGCVVEVRAWSGTGLAAKWSMTRTRSGADGAFEVRIDPAIATEGFGVAATPEGFVEAWRMVKPGEYDEALGVEVVAERARSIVGRVVDDAGRPIPKSGVQLWYGSDTTWPTEGDAEGRFRTPRRAPARAFELIVEAPGYPIRRVPVPASAEDPTDVGDVVFRRGGRIAGTVADSAGNPVQDLRLVLLGVAGPDDAAPRARTDDAGRFEFTDLGEGPVVLCVDAPDGKGGPPGARREYRGRLEVVVAGSAEVKLVVRTETTVVLRFVDAATGKPVDVRKAEYGLRAEGAPEPEHLGQGVSASDALTSTRLSAWPGRHDLTVRSPGFEDARVNGFEIPDRPEFTLDVPMRRRP